MRICSEMYEGKKNNTKMNYQILHTCTQILDLTNVLFKMCIRFKLIKSF